MHDQSVDPGQLYRIGEREQRFIRILIIDPDTALDRHRNVYSRLHRNYAIADQRWFGHQAGAEPSLLDPIGRATDVKIDFVIAEILRNTCRLRERLRVTS